MFKKVVEREFSAKDELGILCERWTEEFCGILSE
jgi:hypothetical protein